MRVSKRSARPLCGNLARWPVGCREAVVAKLSWSRRSSDHFASKSLSLPHCVTVVVVCWPTKEEWKFIQIPAFPAKLARAHILHCRYVNGAKPKAAAAAAAAAVLALLCRLGLDWPKASACCHFPWGPQECGQLAKDEYAMSWPAGRLATKSQSIII